MSLQPGQFVWPSCTAAGCTPVGIAMPRTGVALLVGHKFVGYNDRDGP